MNSALDFGLAPGDTVIAGAPAAWRLTACRDPADGGVHLTRWSWSSCSAEWCFVSDLPDSRGGGDYHLSVREQHALVAFLAPSDPPRPSIAPFTRAERKALSTAIHMARNDRRITDDHCAKLEALIDSRSADRGGDAATTPPAGPRSAASPREKCPACHAIRCRLFEGWWCCVSCRRVWSQSQIDAFYAGTLRIDPLESTPPPADPIEQLRSDATAVHDRVGHAMRRHGAR